LQMVFALRNLGLGLAAFSAWLLCLRLACVVSLFLVLFAVTMTDHPAVMVILAMYSATGSVWLMLVYWTGLRRVFVASDSAVDLKVQTGRERLPWLAMFALIGLVGCVLGLLAVGPQRAARVLAEWLPTSGGTGGYDPFARGGVNDGDDEVKGNNPRSTGMVETEQFLDSPLPSLYDIANDLYGEPFKPQEQEKAIALDGRTKVIESEKPPPDNQRPNREFPTARQGPRQPRDPSDRAARALFEVEGRTPLHVRVAAYDAFDGASWHEAPVNLRSCLIEQEVNSCWMDVQEIATAPIFAENESHKFKITSSFGALVPGPPYLVRFRVGRVNRADFFAWGQDRILRMAQRTTPSGIIVETVSRTVDPRKLDSVRFQPNWHNDRLLYAAVPPSLDPEFSSLSRSWTEGQRPGWPQIAAVIQHLRTDYTLDPAAHTPEHCPDPLAYFLIQARCGPDYQFACAAAVLLRTLGYPTRLVSGFYVSPEAYDSTTRHTPVVREDLHFWPEVMLASGDWLVIEPTPGYEVLGPNLPWSDRALAALKLLGWWLWEHSAALALCVTGISFLWWKRIELVDGLVRGLVRLFPGPSWRCSVRRVLWLLEHRGRWTGQPRRPAQTRAAWLRAVMSDQSDPPGEVRNLTSMAEWCAYSTSQTPPWSAVEVRSVCRQVLDEWNLRRWRMAANVVASPGEHP
jgi:protein-glutamine gamma-glutamyltransferase